MHRRIYYVAIAAIGIFNWTGCSKQAFPVARVSGTVTCDGKSLSEGLVVFTPIRASGEKSFETGRAASGMIQEDGSFELTTYYKGDGAIIGTHSVQVFAVAPIDDDAPLTDANRYACGNSPLQETVEPSDNYFDLELSLPSPSKKRLN